VRQPEGNGIAERFIRTLKENLLWVRHFETIEELRLALLDFAAWYNTHWLVARHGHRTPAHQGRPATGHGSGRMNDAAACLATLVQYTTQRYRPPDGGAESRCD
jgi:hypothetical protein